MTDDRREWYIYVLRDPRNDEVRYVGFTVNIQKRFYSHIGEAINGIRKAHIYSWIRSLLKLDLQPVMEVIERGIGEWQSVEQYWIRHYRMQGARLTNATDGGDGMLGHKQSPEHVEKIRQANLGRKRSPEAIKNMTGRKHSPEHIEKTRQANLGRKRPPEAIERMRQVNLGRKHSPETREKMSRAGLGRKNSPEHIEKTRQANLGRKHSPETRERMRQVNLGRKHSPEHIEKVRQAGLGRKHSPESIKKMKEVQAQRPSISVRRVEDGVIFVSAGDAARSIDGTPSNIRKAIKTGGRASGYHWERVGENTTGRKRSPEAIRNMRQAQTRERGIPVRRVEDGVLFASIREAAHSVDRGPANIQRAITTRGKCAGYHWERVGETPPADPYTLDGNALIMRID